MFRQSFRRAARAVGLLVLVALLADGAHPQPVEKLEPRKVDLHKVANDELLKLGQLALDKGSAAYLAQRRELAAVELALERARKQAAAVVVPPDEAVPDRGDPLEAARAGLDRARGRLDALKQRLDRAQAEKALGERAVAAVEGCTTAATAFANLLDDLDAVVVEARLRVEDRTLPADAVPRGLTDEAVAQRKRDLATEQAQWKQKAEAAQKDVQAAGQRFDAAKKAVLDAEAAVAQADRKYARQQKRQEVEKEYAGRSLADLRTELARLHDEEAGLAGAFNLALRHFRASEAAAAEKRDRLKALRPPEAKAARPDDLAAGVEAAQAQQRHAAARAEALDALRAADQAVIDQGGNVEGEAAVLGDHLFKVQVAAGAIEKAATKEGSPADLPKGLDPAAIAERGKALTDAAGPVLAAVEKARAELADLATQAAEARAAEEAAGKRLADLRQAQEAGQRVLAFEQDLRQRTAAEVVVAFAQADKALSERSPAMKKQEQELARAREAVAALRQRRQALRDPFVRQAEAESQPEKQRLLDELKKHAGLDRAPPGGTTGMSAGMEAMMKEMAPKPTPQPKETDPKDKGKVKEPEKADPLSVQGFQEVLAGRVRVAEEQGQVDAELRKALAGLEKAGEAHAADLGAVRELALRRYAAAVDLKKRLGRGELKADDVPDGVPAALRRDDLTKLDAAAAALVAAQARTRQEAEALGKVDANVAALDAVLKETLTLASQRLDLLAELQRLDREYQRDRKDRPEADEKRLDQAALDRERDEDSWLETFLRVDGSAPAKARSEVLHGYYREAVGLEEQQKTLEEAKGKADKLVELARQEAALLEKARPLLREAVGTLDRQREEEALLAKARLKPDEADELLRAYQARTGKQLPRPVAVAEKDRPAAVQEANAALFDRLLQVEAARRWDALVEGRLSPAGLPAELGASQDRLGALAAAYGTNLRRIRALGGRVEPSPAFPGADAATDAPSTTEVGRARHDLFAVRRDGVLWIVGKIGLILLAAWLLPRLLTAVLQRATADRDGTQLHARLVVAFLQAFLKLIVYTTALVLILSTLGFDITAILAGLGIGGLAIGLAAQHAISDILGGLIIFLERPFSIGDTIRIGDAEPAQVVGLTWRVTRLRDASGVAINIPNRQVTEARVVNQTRAGGQTLDAVPVLVPAVHPVGEVSGWIEQALAACGGPVLADGRDVDVEEMSVSMTGTYYVRYVLRYFIRELTERDAARREVLGRVAAVLAGKGVIVEPRAGR